jgi:hypothetical protein
LNVIVPTLERSCQTSYELGFISFSEGVTAFAHDGFGFSGVKVLE